MNILGNNNKTNKKDVFTKKKHSINLKYNLSLLITNTGVKTPNIQIYANIESS